MQVSGVIRHVLVALCGRRIVGNSELRLSVKRRLQSAVRSFHQFLEKGNRPLQILFGHWVWLWRTFHEGERTMHYIATLF